MPLLKKWASPGTRVLTPVGRAELVSFSNVDLCEVRLDEPWAGRREASFGAGELALDTKYVVIRIINLGIEANPLTSAVNYPSWDAARDAIENTPYIQDETLLALNLETKEAVLNGLTPRFLHYEILSAYYDWHTRNEIMFFDETDRVDAELVWRQRAGLAGVSDHIWLCIFLDFTEMKVIGYARFSAVAVIDVEEEIAENILERQDPEQTGD